MTSDGPLPSLSSFDGKVAEALNGENSVGYLWVKVTDLSPEQVVNLTLARRTGDPNQPWDYREIEDPEGTDAYPALVAGWVDWFGEPLHLRWLPAAEAAAVREEVDFPDPWEVSTVLSEWKSLAAGIRTRLKWRRSGNA